LRSMGSGWAELGAGACLIVSRALSSGRAASAPVALASYGAVLARRLRAMGIRDKSTAPVSPALNVFNGRSAKAPDYFASDLARNCFGVQLASRLKNLLKCVAS
jgi:hypothetical protein